MAFRLMLLMVAGLVSGPAIAQNCAARADVISKLQEEYGEVLRFVGTQQVRGRKAVMEVWASGETGTYSVLITRADGISCIVAVGENFVEAIPAEKAEDTPL